MEFSGQYLTYNEYKALGGNLDQTPFNLLEYEARRKVDERTQQRLKNVNDIPQEVKLCEYTIINNVLKAYNEEIARGKSSESVGSYSVNYSNIKEIIENKRTEIADIISTNLYGVVYNGEHILYCGV